MMPTKYTLWVPVIWQEIFPGQMAWMPDVPKVNEPGAPKQIFHSVMPRHLDKTNPRTQTPDVDPSIHYGDPSVSYCPIVVDGDDAQNLCELGKTLHAKHVPLQDRLMVKVECLPRQGGRKDGEACRKLLANATCDKVTKTTLLVHAASIGLCHEDFVARVTEHGLEAEVTSVINQRKARMGARRES